jgi:uncharacterized protein YkwD
VKASVVAVIGLVACLLVAGCGPGTSSVPAQDLLDQINNRRAAVNCPPVTGNDQLRSAAEREAVDMRDHNSMLQAGTDGHTGSDGSRPDGRIRDSGYAPISRTGEIIYWKTTGASSVQENIDAWMNSPPHRAIIQNCELRDAGVGLLYPNGVKWYSVVDFATH